MSACPTPEKIPHPTEHAARTAADAFRSRKSRKPKGQVRIYRCECGQWHLTKMDAAQFKNRIRKS